MKMYKLFLGATALALTQASLASANTSLDLQVAEHNAQYALKKYYIAQSGEDLNESEIESSAQLISSSEFPAVFEVSLSIDSLELISAEVTCKAGLSEQMSRFTRVTPIHCEVSRVLSQ